MYSVLFKKKLTVLTLTYVIVEKISQHHLLYFFLKTKKM
jgi:hypothetical protein